LGLNAPDGFKDVGERTARSLQKQLPGQHGSVELSR
jgi:hypothetical protein